ncbi:MULTISPECIES: cytochrome c [unclassified Pseudomonas]|jgi:cytochrome c556|uniref:c-type cytochrome n=1 Tax=unclassified Pseudomonas TaxID=196821 RepID=UPI000C86BF40|nr:MULTISPECIES: cytochrome c [unclassified Pseudomonas]PMV89231.1 cytochrome C [Pseudomonas sp. GW101-1A09]PMV97228.1 cytochrome C [Pseudomonas sp. FW306-2-2C-B10A]PMW01006.1 cytochrome C [Pseudomonas sp. GW460-C8]PMW07969.1 cytochrome C [Pseudomonas sp. MPR-TSA4]PMW20297.1 cytochrome C [Pseudomonas sp. FW306-2-1A-C05A]
MTLKRLSVVLLACLTLSACGGVDPNSPLGQRKAIFKQMLKTGEDLGGMLRGRIPFDGPKFAEGAVKLDTLSREPWKHFPQVREEDHSSATDNVWQQQARFQDMVRTLEAATGELVIASKVQPYKASNLGPAVQKVEDACSACHKEFRDH